MRRTQLKICAFLPSNLDSIVKVGCDTQTIKRMIPWYSSEYTQRNSTMSATCPAFLYPEIKISFSKPGRLLFPEHEAWGLFLVWFLFFAQLHPIYIRGGFFSKEAASSLILSMYVVILFLKRGIAFKYFLRNWTWMLGHHFEHVSFNFYLACHCITIYVHDSQKIKST